MVLPALAPVAALEVRLGETPGTLTGADLARAEADLADASALVRLEAGLDWVAPDGVRITAPDSVVAVVARAAKRSYTNPDAYQGESFGGAYSYQYAEGESGVYLTAAETRIVRNAARSQKGGVYTIRTPSAYRSPEV